MKKKLREIAEMIGAEILGDPETNITGVSAIKTAVSGDITFAKNAKYAAMIAGCRASAVVVDRKVVVPNPNCALLRVDNPMTALDKVALLFTDAPPEYKPGIHPTAVIAESAVVDKTAHIGALSVVEENAVIGAGTVVLSRAYIGHSVRVGCDCRIHPGCVVMERCILHNRVLLQPGAVIGGDGFGFSRDEQGRPVKIPQLGWVELEDDVEVGSNSTVDRARFGRTLLEKGVKLDNLVHVGHNVRLGQGCALSGQVGISGSVDVGKNVLFGGQAGVRDNISIGDNAMITARTAVLHDVEAGATFSGFPGLPKKQYIKLYVLHRKLPQLFDKVKRLEERLAQFDGSTKDN